LSDVQLAQYTFFIEQTETTRLKRKLMEQQIQTQKAAEQYFIESKKNLAQNVLENFLEQ
jgi:hypothetical protein